MLTLQEVASVLQMHPVTVRRYARQGRLPGRHFGGKWRFRHQDVQKLVEGK